jgi:ABC-2 type transport system permease protein
VEKLILKFIYLFNGLFVKLGINTPVLYTLLNNKLVLDKRKVVSPLQQQSTSKKATNQKIGLYIGYLVFSLLFAVILGFGDHIFISSLLLHSYLLVMLVMIILTDYSAAWIDNSDNTIILPKPINNITLIFSKALHAFVYLAKYGIVICFASWVTCFIKYGIITGLSLILTSILCILFAFFFTQLLYFSLLRLIKIESLKNFVSYMQILFSVGFFVLSQNLNSFINGAQYQFYWESFSWYHYILPPFWYANILHSISSSSFNWSFWIMLGLAIIIPIVVFYANSKIVTKNFNRILSATEGQVQINTNKKVNTQPRRLGLSHSLSKLFTYNVNEQASFLLVWKYMARERFFKTNLYPSIGIFVAMVLIPGFKYIFNGPEKLQRLTENNQPIFLILVYIFLPVISTGLTILKYSNYYQASYVFVAAPNQKPGYYILGGVKAFLVKIFLPIYLISIFAALFIWGPAVLDDFIWGLLNILTISCVQLLLFHQHIPLSFKPAAINNNSKLIIYLINFGIQIFLIGVHYLTILFFNTYAPIIGILVSTSLLIIVYRAVKNISWQTIKHQS